MDRVNDKIEPGSKPGRKPVIPLVVENLVAQYNRRSRKGVWFNKEAGDH